MKNNEEIMNIAEIIVKIFDASRLTTEEGRKVLAIVSRVAYNSEQVGWDNE